MSVQHLQQVEALIKQAQEFLYTVQRNQAPDMDAFDRYHDEHFQSLKALGPVDLRSPYLPQLTSRMEYLESLNREMIQVVQRLLEHSRTKLQSRSTSRRGVTGYQRSLFGRPRGKGVWRGKA